MGSIIGMEDKKPKDNALLTAYLNEYIKMTRPQFAVMITGKWGCGKTYYINGIIKEWEKEKVRTDADSIRLKPVYVSVYGMQTVGAVVRQIKAKLNPVIYSKGAKVAKKIAFAALQILTKSKVDVDGDGTGEELNSLLDAEGVLEIFKSDSSSIKGHKILVFDDLERSRIPLDEFFGFVNNIVEHSDTKVILVCEEDRLKESADRDRQNEKLKVDYKDFKEKLVGQTFSLEVNYAQIATSFVNATGNKILTENLNLIVDLFVASKCENLRIIKRSLMDIVRLFKQFPAEIEKNANYNLFVKNVVAYTVIASVEDRYGNKDIDNFQNFGLLKEAREGALMIEGKYTPILEHNKLYHSAHSIPFSDLLTFVRTGYFKMPDKVVEECRLFQSRSMANWEKLWWCNTLSNEEFASLLKTEKEKFYKKRLDYVFEVTHLAGILLSLERRGLVKLSRKHVVSVAKSSIASIHKAYSDDVSRLAMNRQGYEFQELDSEEMKEIVSFATELLQERTKRTEKEYVVNAWEKLKPGITNGEIENLFDQPTPTHRCHYSQESIFTQIAPKVMADKIFSLPNDTKMEFVYFLESRYYLENHRKSIQLSDDVKGDKCALKKISAILSKKTKRLKLVDKEVTLLIASKMEEAVAKM